MSSPEHLRRIHDNRQQANTDCMILNSIFGVAVGLGVAATAAFTGYSVGLVSSVFEAVSNPELISNFDAMKTYANYTMGTVSGLFALNNSFGINGDIDRKSFNSGVVISSLSAVSVALHNILT